MAKQPTDLSIVPVDTFFYVIPLENDNLILTKEVLYKHYNQPLGSKRYSERARVNSVSYNRDVFKLSVQLAKEKPHSLFVHIERDELLVACDCGMPENMLCRHAYYGMFYLMHYKDMSLKDYYWPGLQQEVNNKLKYLDIAIEGHHIDIYPKKGYGNLFKPGLGFSQDDDLKFETPKATNELTTAVNKEIIGYAIIYTPFGFPQSHLPFLMPFIGKTSRHGNHITAYERYVRKDRPFKHSIKLTDDQIMLNEISFDMFLLSKSTGKQSDELNKQNWLNSIPMLLALWHKVIPRFAREQYQKGCRNCYGFKSWSNKPRKIDMEDCSVFIDKLSISFALRKRHDFFTLVPVIKTPEKELNHFKKISLFIIDAEDNSFYLVNSTQDEILLNWLALYGYKLTVLEEHFADFHERFLRQLSEYYSVIYQPFKSKKKTPYEFTEVIKTNSFKHGK